MGEKDLVQIAEIWTEVTKNELIHHTAVRLSFRYHPLPTAPRFFRELHCLTAWVTESAHSRLRVCHMTPVVGGCDNKNRQRGRN